jgi:hypothetical protein
MFKTRVCRVSKYCSRKCSDAAHSYAGSENRANTNGAQIPPGSDIIEEARRLHSEGVKVNDIATKLNLTNGAVYHWIVKGRNRKSDLSGSRPHLTEHFFRYIYADTADIWLKVLRDEMRIHGFKPTKNIQRKTPVNLICGTIKIYNNAHTLATIISEKYTRNPFDGEYYAFCGTKRFQIRYLRWDGHEFQMTTRRRERGSYVWPAERLGEIIRVDAREFEFILNGSAPADFPKEMKV